MKIIYSVILISLLTIGIIINYQLDQDFLTLSGLPEMLVILSLIFFIGVKTLTELYFFSLQKWNFRRVTTGIFALSLVIASIYAGSITRTYKAEEIAFGVEKRNSDIEQKNSIVKSNIKRVEKEINVLNTQIQTIQSKLTETHFSYTGIIQKYQSQIDLLTQKKTDLRNDINNLEKTFIPMSKKEVTLLSEHKDTTFLYLFYTILVEFSLIVLSHLISPVFNIEILFRRAIEKRDSDNTSQLKIVNRPEVDNHNQIVNHPDWKVTIRKKMDESDLSKERWARKYLGISRQAVDKLLKGINQPSAEVRQKIDQLAV